MLKMLLDPMGGIVITNDGQCARSRAETARDIWSRRIATVRASVADSAFAASRRGFRVSYSRRFEERGTLF